MNMVITISREYGAGGHSIGQKVAEELGIPFYDKDIMRETAKKSGFEMSLIEKEQEERSTKDSILKGISSASSMYFRDSQDEIFDLQRAVILGFAHKGPCVILGRCADVICKEAAIPSLNVFIHADEVHRAVRVSEMTGSKNATELKRSLAHKDASRHKFYAHYTGKKWGDAANYDLTLDSGVLGYETCINIIKTAVEAAEK